MHYTTVARRMHLGNVTAYEMLRLLESKGLVKSEYRHSRTSSPGRSTVFFRPADRETSPRGEDEWKEATSHILRTLIEGGERSHRKVLEYLIERLPFHTNPDLTVVETIIALLLNLQQLTEEKRRGVVEELRKVGFPTEAGLQVLVGAVVGLVGAGLLDKEYTARLLLHLSGCRDALATLSPEKQVQVSAFVQEVLNILKW